MQRDRNAELNGKEEGDKKNLLEGYGRCYKEAILDKYGNARIQQLKDGWTISSPRSTRPAAHFLKQELFAIGERKPEYLLRF